MPLAVGPVCVQPLVVVDVAIQVYARREIERVAHEVFRRTHDADGVARDQSAGVPELGALSFKPDVGTDRTRPRCKRAGDIADGSRIEVDDAHLELEAIAEVHSPPLIGWG